MRGLPESAFMEIMNNYLGGVKTPYDKNELLNRLSTQLQLPKNIERIASRINRTDLKLLSAVQWFSNPDRNVLIDFFSGSLTPSEVTGRLVNLEERLLIFYDRTGQTPGLVLSPLLAEEIFQKLSPLQIIQFRYQSNPAPQEMPLINGSFLICFLSLLNEDIRICNNDGSIKKKFTSTLSRIFPAAGFTDEPNETLHLLLNALKTLALLSENSGKWHLKMENLKAFSHQERREQLLLLWGALCTREFSKVQDCSNLIAALVDQFPPGAGVNECNLESLILLLRDRVLEEDHHLSTSYIIKILKHFHFITEDRGIWYLHPMIPSLLDEKRPAHGSLFLHATFDVNLTPDTPFSLPLAMSLTTDRYDSFAQLRLTDASFRRLLKAGLTLDELNYEISERYALTLPQNILFSLKDWEADYGGLRLWKGIVLQVCPERIPLIQQNKRLMELVNRKLGEGIYLLAEEDREEWEEAMQEIGIETVPRTENPGRKVPKAREYRLKENSQTSFFPETSSHPEDYTEEEEYEDNPHDEKLKELVRSNKTFSEDEKDDLLGRIDRGVIYQESQIKPGIIRSELTIVKGLDYQGKLRMIQSVLGNRAYQLEVTLPTDDYDLITHRIIPRSMEQEKDTQTMLTGTELPDKPFSCPVRKISRIRKIRSSLF
ncbi:MAG: hypothetical protein B6241_12815 [Spirochaetaceae bacterium 4572_59]|nr:MAG: hypothetical protein B6241_12815 [Spirochaetaceae bacterium 4572_59]